MNPAFGSRRRADEFDRLLSRSSRSSHPSSSGPSPDDATAAQYADLLALVGTLRATPAPAPRAAFSADLRERLMLAADEALAPAAGVQPAARPAPVVRRSGRERRVVAAVGGFAIVSATASMAVAAQSALPGDTLYPLKRAIENAQAGAQGDADDRGTALLDNAAGRLDEVGTLSRTSGGDDAQTIATTLDDFVAQASEASDLLLGDFQSTGHASSIEELRTFTADSMGALTSLQSLIPDDARASLIQATQVINAIDVQAQSLCPSCTDLPIMETPLFASRTVDTLLGDALDPVLEPLLPAAGTTASDPGTSRADRSGTGQGRKAGDRTPAASGPISEVLTPPAAPAEQPGLPQPPSSSGSGDSGGKKGDRGLLDDLTVKGDGGAIGDLLTGTGDAVDDVVEGVDGVVEDLGTGLGDGLGILGGTER